MYQRGIRGATTLERNTVENLKEVVVELLTEMKKRNNYDEKDIASVFFSLTDDIDCVHPAKIAREVFPEWKYVPMMCYNEMRIKNSLTMCLRVLVNINTNLEQKDIHHVFLRSAEKLREDLK